MSKPEMKHVDVVFEGGPADKSVYHAVPYRQLNCQGWVTEADGRVRWRYLEYRRSDRKDGHGRIVYEYQERIPCDVESFL